jgi:3-dehydroquinate dehydratase-2
MSSHNRVAVLHGVNLDQLGGRDPLFYGDFTLAELEHRIGGWAKDLGLEAACSQTNHEGEYIEHLHRLAGTADAAILNAGAWTHYSWAIRDALEASGVPAVEVHISDVMAREEWRHFSVFDGLVVGRVSGKGAEGYREALEILAERLGGQ